MSNSNQGQPLKITELQAPRERQMTSDGLGMFVRAAPPPQIPQHTHIHPSVLGNKPLIGCLLKRYVHLHVTITFFKFLLGCTDLNIINYSKMYRNTFQSYFPLLSSRENYFPIMTKLNQSTL